MPSHGSLLGTCLEGRTEGARRNEISDMTLSMGKGGRKGRGEVMLDLIISIGVN